MDINRLENELNRLDIDWEREKQTYMVSGRYGHRYLPKKGSSVIGGILVTVFGLIWTCFAFGMSTGFGRENAGFGGGPGFPFSCFPFFGIVFIAVGIGTSIYAYNKAGQYEQAEQRNLNRKDKLRQQLAKLRRP